MSQRWCGFYLLVLPLSCGWLAGVLMPVTLAAEPKRWAEEHVAEWIPLYHHLHQNPELSFQEHQTAEFVAKRLESLGIEVTRGVGGTGIVGVLRNGDGKTLLIRTDLDALPVTEQTGLPYASRVTTENPDGPGTVGVMHACGHDIHMTTLLGTAQYLATHRDVWRGTILFIGQPAEEKVSGAVAMLNDGLYTRFGRPDFALALHVDSGLEAGKVGYRGGFALANSDSVDITIRGVGGHGAQPHTTVDPVVQAAQLVLALQTIVSREVLPTEPAVITVGSIHGGFKHNIISDECKLQLTVRSYSPEVRQQLLDAIRAKAHGVAVMAGAPDPLVEVNHGTAAVFNHQDLVERLVPVFRETLGDEQVVPVEPTMGAEDFGMFSRDGVPVMMFRLGSVDAERKRRMNRSMSLHSALYYPDAEPTLITGVAAMSAAAIDLLQ